MSSWQVKAKFSHHAPGTCDSYLQTWMSLQDGVEGSNWGSQWLSLCNCTWLSCPPCLPLTEP